MGILTRRESKYVDAQQMQSTGKDERDVAEQEKKWREKREGDSTPFSLPAFSLSPPPSSVDAVGIHSGHSIKHNALHA